MRGRNSLRKSKLIVLFAIVLALLAGSAVSLVHDRGSASPLQAREFIASELDITPINVRPAGAIQDSELQSLGANTGVAFLDARGGRWRTLLLARPVLPGSGVGNDLTWESARPVDDEDLGKLAWQRIRKFVEDHANALRINVSELDHRVAVHNGGELIQIWADRVYNGIPVRGAGFTAVINHGNLVLMGAERWSDIALNRLPTVSAAAAVARVASFLAPTAVDSLQQDSYLVILPASSASGDAYSHRLAWVVHPHISGDLGQWEALVDVHDGKLLAFQDLNHYGADRTVSGGVYPVAYDGIAPDGNMVANYPMPFADVSSGGFTDAGGNFSGAGGVTTTLSGQFINIQEFCGAISESSTGDIDLEGTDGDKDCTVPAGHSVGDTAAARSAFYELNRIKAQALGLLPGNAWLAGTLTAQMNINQTCGAFWTGSVVQFFLETFPCGNTGQLAGVFDHEWGHGMDDNDVNGSIPGFSQGGGEGIADVYAALRLNQGCVGRGFFQNGSTCGGYGDPCTPASGCTGIRSVDFADRTSGLPHDLTWVRANCGSVHCLGAAYSETVWDLLKRDLPTLHGMDNNTALEVTTRLTFIGAGNASGWFDTSGPPVDAAACGATQAYLQFLAADDDDGNIANGTPHMDAIASAFDRHQIGCTPANGGPTVTVSGCAGTPSTAPVLSASGTSMGADLSWTDVSASTYNIYRTDGEHECDFGKELVGSTAGTTFADSGLMNDRLYSYVVIPMGAGGASCFGPASNCASTLAGAGIFCDGFESGDISAWSNGAPFSGSTGGRRGGCSGGGGGLDPGDLSFIMPTYTVNESSGTASVAVSRTGGSDGAVSVRCDTADGTATAPDDYTATMDTLNWADGDTANETCMIPIINDKMDESDETIGLTLTNFTGGAGAGTNISATLTIIDDDEPGDFGFNLVPTPATLDVCAPTDPDPTVDIDVTSTGGWSFAVNLATSSEPPDTTSTLVPNDQLPDFTSTYTLLGTDTSTSGTYTIDFAGTGSDAPPTLNSTQVVLNLAVANPGAPTLAVPADGAGNQRLAQTLTWTAGTDAISYDLEVATDAGFTNIIYSVTGLTGLSHTLPFLLDPGATYFWRVTANNACGTLTTDGFSFTTVLLICEVFDSTDAPLSIPEAGGTSGPTTSTLTIDAEDGATIVDINILNLIGTHTSMGDLDFNIDSPTATSLRVLDQNCGTAEDFDLNLDDEVAPGSPPCPPTDGGTYQPANPLSVFNGEDSTGTWTLTINDNAVANTGQLDSWSLEICMEGNTAPQVTIVSPQPNASFPKDTTIPFAGFANDQEDDNEALTATLNWSSTLEGPLGSGGCFPNSFPVAGTYTITAGVTDSGSSMGSNSVTITITEPEEIFNWMDPEVDILHPADSPAPKNISSLGSADLKLEMIAPSFVCPGTMGITMRVTNLSTTGAEEVKVCTKLHGTLDCNFANESGATLFGTESQSLSDSVPFTNLEESVGPDPTVIFLFTTDCANDMTGGVPICELGGVAPSSFEEYTITACVLGTGDMVNSACAESTTTDPDTGNNCDSATTTVDTALIFADGFESGNTSAWSSTIPFSTL